MCSARKDVEEVNGSIKKRLMPVLAFAFIGVVVLGLLVNTASGQSSNREEDGTLVLRIANPQATGDVVTQGYEKFAELLEERSGGKMRIELYSNAVLGGDRATTEAVQENTLDMASCSSPNFAGFIPEFMAFDLPYITDPKYQENLYDALDNGELGEYYKEVARSKGFEIISFTEFGYRNFAMADKEVKSADDFKGVKLRTTDSPVEIAVARALGAQAMPVAWGETYTALSQGAIDGEGNTWSLLYSAKHYEALKYGIESRHNYSMHILVMNKERYDAMSPDERDLLVECARDALDWQRENAAKVSVEAKQAMIDSGVTIYDPTDAEMQAFKDKTDGVYDQFVGSRVPEKAVELIQATQTDDYKMLGDAETTGEEE